VDENNEVIKNEADGDHTVNDNGEVMEMFGTYVVSKVKSTHAQT
jgi:hypothetical protein